MAKDAKKKSRGGKGTRAEKANTLEKTQSEVSTPVKDPKPKRTRKGTENNNNMPSPSRRKQATPSKYICLYASMHSDQILVHFLQKLVNIFIK